MGNDEKSKGQPKDRPQVDEHQPMGSEGSWLFARNPVTDPKTLEQKVAESCALVDTLSLVQRRILDLIVDGHCNRTIAEATGSNPETIMSERRSIFAKLGAQTTTDAVRIGIYAQMHNPPDPVPTHA